MAYYWTCPLCGANLDPGEQCDCKKRKPKTHCFTCGMPLFPEDSLHDQDPAYEIDGHVICENCIDKYVRRNCFKVLRG